MEWLKLLDSPSPWTAAWSRRSCSGSPLSRSDSGASARNEGTDCNMGHSPAPYPWRGPLTHRGSSSGAGIRAAVGIALVECRHGSKPLKWINHLEWIKRKSNCHQALKLKEAKDLNDQHNKLYCFLKYGPNPACFFIFVFFSIQWQIRYKIWL